MRVCVVRLFCVPAKPLPLMRGEEMKTPHRFNELRLSMFSPESATKFPRLKGKASEVKHVTEAFLRTWEKVMRHDNREHRLIQVALLSAEKMESIIDENANNYRLPPHVADEWKKQRALFVQTNAALGHAYHTKGIFLFHFTVKYHYILHLALLGRVINPRVAWCFSGEDLMQRVKAIFQTCHFGSPPHRAAVKVLDKYAVALMWSLSKNPWK